MDESIKKQTTKWKWRIEGAEGTFIRIGWIYNKSQGCKDDKIRIQIDSLHTYEDLCMTIGEALGICAGINKIIAQQYYKERIILNEKD